MRTSAGGGRFWRRTSYFFLGAVLVLFLASSCATIGVPPSATGIKSGNISNQAATRVPDWLAKQDYSKAGYRTARGHSGGESSAGAPAEAQADALNQLAAQISVSIVSQEEIIVTEIDGQSKESFCGKIFQSVDLENLAGVRLETYSASNGPFAGYWVYAEITENSIREWRNGQVLTYRIESPLGNPQKIAVALGEYLTVLWPEGFNFIPIEKRSGVASYVALEVFPRPSQENQLDSAIRDFIMLAGGGQLSTRDEAGEKNRYVFMEKDITDSTRQMIRSLGDLSFISDSRTLISESVAQRIDDAGFEVEEAVVGFKECFQRSLLSYAIQTGFVSFDVSAQDDGGQVLKELVVAALASVMKCQTDVLSRKDAPIKAKVVIGKQDPSDLRFPIKMEVDGIPMLSSLRIRALVNLKNKTITDNGQVASTSFQIISVLAKTLCSEYLVPILAEDTDVRRALSDLGGERAIRLQETNAGSSFGDWLVFFNPRKTSAFRKVLEVFGKSFGANSGSRIFSGLGIGAAPLVLRDLTADFYQTPRAAFHYIATLLSSALWFDSAIAVNDPQISNRSDKFLEAFWEAKAVLRTDPFIKLQTTRQFIIDILPTESKKRAQVVDVFLQTVSSTPLSGGRDLTSFITDPQYSRTLDADSTRFLKVYSGFNEISAEERRRRLGSLSDLSTKYAGLLPDNRFHQYFWLSEFYTMLGDGALVDNEVKNAFSFYLRAYLWSNGQVCPIIWLIDKYRAEWLSFKEANSGTAFYAAFYKLFISITGDNEDRSVFRVGEYQHSRYVKEYGIAKESVRP